jgi:hypothetical protein
MRLLKYPAAVLLALLVAGSIRSNQQERSVSAIRTPAGAILVWNQADNYFTLDINGKEVLPNNSTNDVMFKVDGLFLQVQAAAFSEIFKESSAKGKTAESILLAHRDWESEYAEGVFGKKLSVQSAPVKLKNGNDALFWSYDMPADVKADAKKQVFLTTIHNEFVVILNSAVLDTTQEAEIRQLLTKTLETMKVSQKPFDVEKLRDSVIKP